jgi:hypothetical protein
LFCPRIAPGVIYVKARWDFYIIFIIRYIVAQNNYFMMQLPTPILGEITAITITSIDLDTSFAWYQKLGFREVFQADWPFPWIQITDGALLIMLRKDANPYIALTYYVKDIDKVVADLKGKGIKFLQEAKASDMVKRYLLQSPDGMNVSLVNIVDGFYQPGGATMLKMNPQDYFNPEKYENKICGLFGEFAHPVADLEAAIVWWELLGFKAVSKFTNPYPWAILSDGISIVGAHQTSDFTQPIITYFASDMKDKIAKLKEGGMNDFDNEGANNTTLTTPEQQKINLFKLGM